MPNALEVAVQLGHLAKIVALRVFKVRQVFIDAAQNKPKRYGFCLSADSKRGHHTRETFTQSSKKKTFELRRSFLALECWPLADKSSQRVGAC